MTRFPDAAVKAGRTAWFPDVPTWRRSEKPVWRRSKVPTWKRTRRRARDGGHAVEADVKDMMTSSISIATYELSMLVATVVMLVATMIMPVATVIMPIATDLKNRV
jgi:hypothetical protein